jgi:hypothetical protein
MDLINAGIIIVTLLDNQIYSGDKLRNDWTPLIVSLVTMSRAHEESRVKSQRCRDAWQRKRDNIPTEKMTSRCPSWLLVAEDWKSYNVIPEYAETIRTIFEYCANGMGSRLIAKRLNQDTVPFFFREGNKKSTKEWTHSTVKRILDSRSVIGEYQPCKMVDGERKPEGPAIPNYFPRIITDEKFYKAHSAMQSRTHKGGRKGKTYPNVFSGLGVCENCGGPLNYVNTRNPKRGRGGAYLICAAAIRGRCTNHVHMSYDQLESHVLSLLPHFDCRAILGKADTTDPVADAEAVLVAKEAKLAKWQAQFEGDDAEALGDLMIKLLREIRTDKKRLEELREKAELTRAEGSTHDRVNDLIELMMRERAALDDERFELRTRIAGEFRKLIERLTLSEKREVSLTLKPAGGYRVTLDITQSDPSSRKSFKMVFQGARFEDIETGEITDIPAPLFLEAKEIALIDPRALADIAEQLAA